MEEIINLLLKEYHQELKKDNPEIAALLDCCEYEYTIGKVTGNMLKIVDDYIESLNT